VRASIGTLFSTPIVETDAKTAITFLKKQGIKIVAATPSAQKLYTEEDLTGPLAIAMGCEQLGLSALFMEEADIQVRIPMLGAADSLNVAMATTLMLFEAVR
jgi:RNA methyltransferase, TrmH family